MGGVEKAKGAGTKGKCFDCGEKGHWKKNCPDFLSKKKTSGMIESLVTEVSFATSTSGTWCVDSVQLITYVTRCRGSRKPGGLVMGKSLSTCDLMRRRKQCL